MDSKIGKSLIRYGKVKKRRIRDRRAFHLSRIRLYSLLDSPRYRKRSAR